MITDMPSLIAPNAISTLVAAIVEDRRLHLRTDNSDAFARLLPWADFNALVTLERLQAGQLCAIRNGHDLPLAMLTAPAGPGGAQALAPDTLQALADEGLSLVINDIDKLTPAIGALAAMVERHLRARSGANAYASFRRGSAFSAHWDDHDVLVLQVHGRKRWFCYGQRHRYPVKGATPLVKIAESEEPEWSEMLEPGDILYIPRGEYHRAQVEEGHSLHLTIGLAFPRGDDVARWVAQRCLKDEVFRRDISALAGPEALAARQEELRDALHRAVDTLDLDHFLAAADRRRDSIKPLNLGLSDPLDPTVLIQPMLRRRLPLPEGTTQLQHGGATTPLTAPERTALALLLDRDAIRLGALIEALPELSPEEVRHAVSGLARKSLVLLSERPA